MRSFPITAKLNPLAGLHNVGYLLEIAVLTRVITSLVRVWQNKPSKINDPRLTPNQKRQALLERAFVELLGTLGYIISLHLGQDLFAKAFEKGWLGRKMSIPTIAENLPGLKAGEAAIANDAIKEVFGKNTNGLICRVLYGTALDKEGKSIFHRATLSTLLKALQLRMGEVSGESVFNHIRPAVERLTRPANLAASLTILGGIITSALLGGLVTQWVNDRIVAPFLSKTLTRIYGKQTLPDKVKPRGLPTYQPFIQQPQSAASFPQPVFNTVSPANWPPVASSSPSPPPPLTLPTPQPIATPAFSQAMPLNRPSWPRLSAMPPGGPSL